MDFSDIKQRIMNRLSSELPPDWGEFYRSGVGFALVNTIAAEFAYLYAEVSKVFNESFLSTANSAASLYNWAHSVGYPIIRDRSAEVSVSYTHNAAFPPLSFKVLPLSILKDTFLPRVVYTGLPVLYFENAPMSLDTFTPGMPAQFEETFLISSGSTGTLKLISGLWKTMSVTFGDFMSDPEIYLEGPIDDTRILVFTRKNSITGYQISNVLLHKEVFKVLDYGGLHESTTQGNGVLLRYEKDFPASWFITNPPDEIIFVWFSPYQALMSSLSAWSQKSYRWFQSNEGITLQDTSWKLNRDWYSGEDLESIRRNVRNWIISRGVVVNVNDIEMVSKMYMGSGLVDTSTSSTTTGLVKISYLYKESGQYRLLSNSEKINWLTYLNSRSIPGITFQIEDPIARTYIINIDITVQSLRYIEAQQNISTILNNHPLRLNDVFNVGELLKQMNQVPGILAISYNVSSSDPITDYRHYHNPTFNIYWNIV